MPRTPSEPPSLVDLLIQVTSKPRHRWSALTDRDTVLAALEAALQNPPELHALRTCYPDPTLRHLRLHHLLHLFDIPDHWLDTLEARLSALPPRPAFPDSPELGDWAWERRRELFGRH